jgi:RNA polymerase sigma-70 factor, ECF subfamily
MEETDSDLVKAVGAGDHQAFEYLVKKYQRPVFNFIYRYLGERHAAEDILQEVFLGMYRAAARLEARAQVSTWLFKIAYNLSMNEIKRRKRHLKFDEALHGLFHIDTGQSALRAIEARELEESVMTALDQLPENQKAAMLLRVNEELSYAEISEVLSVSVSGVESLIFRARGRLGQLLKRKSKE